jgi:hypothetical protein
MLRLLIVNGILKMFCFVPFSAILTSIVAARLIPRTAPRMLQELSQTAWDANGFPWLRAEGKTAIVNQLRKKTNVIEEGLSEWMLELSRMKVNPSYKGLHESCGYPKDPRSKSTND